MARILVTFLGTGPSATEEQNKPNRNAYNKANYKIEDKVYSNKFFIAEALKDHFSIDKIIVIGTQKSIWELYYEEFSKLYDSFDENYWIELWNLTSTANHKSSDDGIGLIQKIENYLPNSKVVVIKYGLNDSELEYNFERIVEAIEDESVISHKDDIYIDITHAFRSIPVYAMTLIMYLNDVFDKSTNIKGLYYGMYDVSREFEDKTAPIVNLKAVLDTMKWIKAAYAFKAYGNAIDIAELIDDKTISIRLTEFSETVSINFLHEMYDKVQHLKSLKPQLDGLSGFGALIIPKVVNKFLDKFIYTSGKMSKFQLALAEWYAENNIYSSAYIVISESIITYICECEGLDHKIKARRDEAKGRITNPKYINIKNVYNKIIPIRNCIAHNKFNKIKLNSSKSIQEFKSSLKLLKNII